VEDLNRDQTMNTINAYYEYKVDINSNTLQTVGQNYITDIRITTVDLPNGGTTQARWVLFKIPVTNPDNTIGGISDFRSIRFMRMFMTGFTEQVTLRFGALDLVRGEWRRYVNTLDINDPNPDDDGTIFDVQAVNIQENSQRTPINYVTPPGVVREQLYNNNTLINQNEQSLSLRVTNLEPADSRAVFKNVSVDMRQYKKLKMFLHEEGLPTNENSVADDELVGFIRFGNDFTQNYYQVEIPLKKTNFGTSNPDLIWPQANEIDLDLSLLTLLKIQAMSIDPSTLADGVYYQDEEDLIASAATKPNKLRLGVKGNPNFGLVRTLMIGVKNQTNTTQSDGGSRDLGAEVWFNELRLAELDNKGGMAAVASVDANMADFATISATGRLSTFGFGSLEQGPNERSREDIKQYNIVTNFSLGKLLPKKWGINLPFNYAIGEEYITPEYDPFNQDIRLQQLLDNTPDEAEQRNIRNRAIDYTKRQSINFIGVRKERGEEQKSHFYDPENLTLSYSYNQVERHNYEIENFIDQQVNTSADYTYAFAAKPIEPFKSVKTFQKSNYWKMLKDFNFNYLPSSVSFRSNIIRQYNKQSFRLVDVEGIGLESLFQRNYLFNYQYGFNYNLTKALKLNFTSSTNNIVRNYIDANNVPDNTNTIWTDFWNVGEANTHNQQLVLNYELPLNKLPFFSFIKSTYTYTGDYSWLRSSVALSNFTTEDGTFYDLGNTIQNAGSHKLNTAFNMDSFYKYIGLTKTKNNRASITRPTTPPKPGEKIVAVKPQTSNERNFFVSGLIGVLTSVKNIQIDYTENRGTALPGYTPGIGFLGTSRPTLGFVLGSQDDIRFQAAQNGWLTNYPDFNQNFTQVTNKILNYTANIDLFPDFKIDVNANRTFADNFSEQYDVTNGVYNSRSPYNFGNFAISTILIKTAFSKSDENQSAPFDDFRNNRLTVANRLATNFYGANTYPTTADGFPVGFGKNSQDVLLPSFLAAYSGQSASSTSLGIFRSFPVPNWNVKYSGLMRYDFFKDKFKRFSLQHNYRASYTVNSFRSNFEYDKNPTGLDVSGNFRSKTIVGNINLVEQFSPLIRIDFELKNSFQFLAELKRDRALSMSFDNNLLTEVKGNEYVVRLGYRFKDVIFRSQLVTDPSGIIKGDINLKMDFSYRKNKTIVRYLDYENNQVGGGQDVWSAKLTADYSFSRNLTAILFYDHQFSQAVISTAFPLTNIRAGITLRYNFGN
jgi:cell surface protein SprA